MSLDAAILICLCTGRPVSSRRAGLVSTGAGASAHAVTPAWGARCGEGCSHSESLETPTATCCGEGAGQILFCSLLCTSELLAQLILSRKAYIYISQGLCMQSIHFQCRARILTPKERLQPRASCRAPTWVCSGNKRGAGAHHSPSQACGKPPSPLASHFRTRPFLCTVNLQG